MTFETWVEQHKEAIEFASRDKEFLLTLLHNAYVAGGVDYLSQIKI